MTFTHGDLYPIYALCGRAFGGISAGDRSISRRPDPVDSEFDDERDRRADRVSSLARADTARSTSRSRRRTEYVAQRVRHRPNRSGFAGRTCTTVSMDCAAGKIQMQIARWRLARLMARLHQHQVISTRRERERPPGAISIPRIASAFDAIFGDRLMQHDIRVIRDCWRQSVARRCRR